MKRLFYIPFVLFIIFSCKDEKDGQVSASMASDYISGKWLLTETEQVVNGKLVWQPVVSLKPSYLVFRADGAILDENGEGYCCPPSVLVINGNKFNVTGKAVPAGVCSTVLCASCLTWDVDVSGNTMLITYCSSSRSKFVRN